MILSAGSAPITRLPKLGPRDVHIWRIAAQDWPPAPRRRACLSTAERCRAARLHATSERRLYLAAHDALRHLLGLYLGQSPQDIPLRRGPGGKPRLATGRLFFNLSHSGGHALIAIARAAQTGIDIERMRPFPHIEAFAQRFMAICEQDALRDCPPADRAALFFQIWALKEAFVKATGQGLGRSLNSFGVNHQSGNVWKLHSFDDSVNGMWSAQSLPAAPGMHAALVIGIADPNIDFFRISALRKVVNGNR
ncbi:MAG: 4'-phosphopantetheinyl transferase family protein [Paracoccaceae bacterium]